MTDYKRINAGVSALVDGVPHVIANLANVSALLWQEMDNINWVGFYVVSGETLVLGPFQGKPACIEIPLGKGVCGTAAATGEIQLVPDVHEFPGHIACDADSNSEIVLPIKDDSGRVIAVLDIDSPVKARFCAEDASGLAETAKIVENAVFRG